MRFIALGSISWTTLVVHSRDVEDCGGAPRRKSTLKPTNFSYITIWQHWLGNTKHIKAFRLILNPFKKLLQNFKNFLFNGIFYWLTNCLMPSDSRNSTMAKAMGLIFSLFNVASARQVPFAILLYMQCILHGLTMVLLCVPFIFVHHKKCWLHVMASICYGNDL